MGRPKSNLSRDTRDALRVRLRRARETDEERSARQERDKLRAKRVKELESTSADKRLVGREREKLRRRVKEESTSVDKIRIKQVRTLMVETDPVDSEQEWLDRVRLRGRMDSEKAWLDSMKHRLNCEPRIYQSKKHSNVPVPTTNTSNCKLQTQPHALNSENDEEDRRKELGSENNQIILKTKPTNHEKDLLNSENGSLNSEKQLSYERSQDLNSKLQPDSENTSVDSDMDCLVLETDPLS